MNNEKMAERLVRMAKVLISGKLIDNAWGHRQDIDSIKKELKKALKYKHRDVWNSQTEETMSNSEFVKKTKKILRNASQRVVGKESEGMKIKEKRVAGLNPEKLPNLNRRAIRLFDENFKKILFEMRLTADLVEKGDSDAIDFLNSLAKECDSAAGSLKIAAKGYRMIANRVEEENR